MLKLIKVFGVMAVIVSGLAAQFASGSGTEDDPWIITTAEQLENVRNYLSDHFKLGGDIDLNGTANNQWTAIGTKANQFTGTLDGDGHVIRGIYIDNNLDYQGLFGVIDDGATVKNLGIKESLVRGRDYLGGLAGYVGWGSIINCYASVSVEAASSQYLIGVVLDDFDMRVLDDEGNIGFTNKNLLGDQVGSWYAWDWNINVTDHDHENIVGVTDEVWIDRVLGDGRMNAIIDAKGSASIAYAGAVETYFFDDKISVDISGLKEIRIKGELQGAIYLGILTDAWDYGFDGGVWAWSVINSNTEFEPLGEDKDSFLVLTVDQNIMGSTWGTFAAGGTLEDNLKNATGISIMLETAQTDYAKFSIDEIVLVFEERNGLPAQFFSIPKEISTYVGGLVGFVEEGIISNSYSTGNVKGDFDVGGLVGFNRYGLITNSYYDRQTSGQDDTDKGIPRTTIQMKQESVFVGWDFVNVWGISSDINDGYPYLRNAEGSTSVRNIQKSDRRRGIRFAMNPVSDKAEIFVSEGKITQVVIYDALGNIVYDRRSDNLSSAHNTVVWDLTNTAGRRVAEGTYLVTAEVKSRDGTVRWYSAKMGVKR